MELENELLIDARFSTWQNRQVRTIIVNSRAKLAGQRSISAAINAARPYDRVELVGGEYFETISIPFPLEIVASEGEDVRISFRGTCLTAATDCAAYVANIEFVSKGKQRNDAAVTITAGATEFSRCRMSSCTISGKASPTLHRCKIYDSLNGVGVRVVDGGGGVIDSCEIANHACVCLEVDTLGDLVVKGCVISQPHSGVTVVAVQAIMSNSSKYSHETSSDGQHPGVCCRRVRFVENRIFAREGVPYADSLATQSHALGMSQGGAPIPVLSSFGAACCALVSHEAEPLFEGNEFSEGSVGMIYERLGAATLKGNIFRLQRSCGIFFLLPENDLARGDVKAKDSISVRQSVRITDHNIFDRCRIGIDVQCGASGALSVFQHDADVPLRLAKEVVHRAVPHDLIHSWFVGLEAFTEAHIAERKGEKDPMVLDAAEDAIRVGSDCHRTTPAALAEFLLSVVEDVFLAHPHVHRQVRDGSAAATPSGYLTTSHTSTTFGFLSALLGDPTAYRSSLRRDAGNEKNSRVANESLEILRGGFGLHLVETRFLNCSYCGVRFGNNGRGLVDACEFDRCGAAAILTESGSVPMIVGCKFQNNAECSIQVRTDANPLIVCNAFESSAAVGVKVQQYARGLILGNTISGCEGFGLDVEDCSTSIVAHNFFTRNKGGGARACRGSRPLLLANQFTGNFGEQVHVASHAAPMLLRNIIISGGTCGMLFTDCGSGTVKGNAITFQTLEGIRIELDADPLVEGNTIANNKGHGVYIGNNGAGSIICNALDSNELCNIRLEEGGCAVIRGNRITGGFVGGVSAGEEGCGLVEKNTIMRNGLANVVIHGQHTNPIVQKNEIGECYSGVGVLCQHGASGTVDRNTIHDNKTCAVMVESSANPRITRNRIFSETAGVVVTNGGRGVVEENSLYDLHGTGIVLQERGDAEIFRNTISSCALCGLLITPDALGCVRNNTIKDCGVGCINGHSGGGATQLPSSSTQPAEPLANQTEARTSAVQKKSQPLPTLQRTTCEVLENTIEGCIDCGVLLESGAAATFKRNAIQRNGNFGVLCDVQFRADRLAALAQVRKKAASTVAGSVSRALQWWETSCGTAAGIGGGTAVFEDNEIARHRVANVTALQHPTNAFVFRRNRITEAPCGLLVRNSTLCDFTENVVEHAHEGLVYESNGRGTAEGNTVRGCSLTGVYLASGGDPILRRNTVTMCGTAGVMCDAGSRGQLQSNSIRQCVVGVVLFTSGAGGEAHNGGSAPSLSSTTLLEDNEIAEHELHGVLILGSTYPFPIRQIRCVPSVHDAGSRGGIPTNNETDPTSRPATPSRMSRTHLQAELNRFYQLPTKDGDRRFPVLRQNRIFRNRFCGVFREQFQMLELPEEDPRRIMVELDCDNNPVVSAAATPEKQKTSRVGRRPLQTIQSPVAVGGPHNKKKGSAAAASACDGPMYDKEPHLHQCIVAHPSLVDNDVYENSFGIGVGQELDLFVLRCDVHHNAFFGLFVRSTGRPEVVQTKLHDNGLAGVYAARFSAGCVSHSTISENNLLCRDDGLATQSRSISTFVVSARFCTLVTDDDSWLLPGGASPEGQCLLSMAMNEAVDCYRQLTTTLSVHNTVLDGASSILAEVIAAPSNVLSIASSILPNPFFAAASAGVPNASSNRAGEEAPPSAAALAGGSTMTFATEIMDQNNSAPVSDGGMGVWIEEGARIEFTDCTITEHRNCGVLFSRGLLAHHHVIRQTFERSQQNFSLQRSNTNTVLNASLGGSATLSRFAPAIPGVLFTHQTLINNAATTGCDASVFDRTATFLDATATSSSGGGGNGLAGYSPGRGGGGPTSGGTPHGSPGNAFATSGATVGAYNLAGAPLLRRCTITGNGKDGVRIQLFHSMLASKLAVDERKRAVTHGAMATTATDKPNAKRKGSVGSNKPRSVSIAAGDVAQEATSVAPPPLQRSRGAPLPHVFDADLAALQFAIVMEDNVVARNRWRGVLCEHIAEINCASIIPSRIALHERFEEQAAQAQSEVEGTLRRGSTNERAVRALDLQRCVVEPGRLTSVRHANLRQNRFEDNRWCHIECTSRFVVYTGDKQRTLVHVDASLDKAAAKTMFGFGNLMKVPLVYDLTLCPVPGIFLIEENDLGAADVGIHVCGIVATQASRIRRNTFHGHRRSAILIDGPRAAACIGDANTFVNNEIGICFHRSVGGSAAAGGTHCDQPPDLLLAGSSGMGSSALSASRVYKNVFRNNRIASILVETQSFLGGAAGPFTTTAMPQLQLPTASLLPPPVIFKNEFDTHGVHSAGVLIAGPHAAAWVTSNAFHHNVLGVLATNQCGATADRAVLIEHNRFSSNVVGCMTAGRAVTQCVGNYFKGNRWCGLCVTHPGSRVAAKECCFDGHTPALAEQCPSLTATDAIVSAQDVRWDVGGPLFSTSVRVPRPLPSHDGTSVPCGLVVDPCASLALDNTLFLHNDVGMDLVRDVVPTQKGYWPTAADAGAADGNRVVVRQCIFRNHVLAGVHVRGSPSRLVDATDVDPDNTVLPQPLGDASASPSTTSPQMALARKTRSANSEAVAWRGAYSATVEHSFFEDNGALRGGDVYFTNFGHAELVSNTFASVVRSSQNGYGAVRACLINGSRTEIGIALDVGARTSFVSNIIRDKRVCIRADSGSHAVVEHNLLSNAQIGIETEPNCSTTLQDNTVALMEDCGALLRGGIVTGNLFTACPVGVVVQGVSAPAPGVGGIQQERAATGPASDVDVGGNYELRFLDNTVRSCDSDGVLVGGGGLLEGNHISNNKTNVSVVCVAPLATGALPPAHAPMGSSTVPRLNKNFIFDGQFGVVLTSNSVCFLTNNDIFDNAICGVVCQPAAGGLVESNHISSALNHGALEIAPECPCQIHHNTVRNQFSPAYKQGLALQRVKTLHKESQKLATTLGEADEQLSQAQTTNRTLSSALTLLYNRLRSAEEATVASMGEAAPSTVAPVQSDVSRPVPLGSRPRSLSFSPFEHATSVLTQLSDAPGRSQSAVGRVRSLQQLRAAKEHTRTSVSASSVIKGAIQNRAHTDDTTKVKAGRKVGRHRGAEEGCRILIHTFQSPNDGVPTSGVCGERPAAASVAEVLNALGASFQGSSTTMVTSEPSAAVSAIKSQSPNVVVFVVPPGVKGLGIVPAPEGPVVSANDAMSIPRLHRLLQTLRGVDGGPLKAALLCHEDSCDRLLVEDGRCAKTKDADNAQPHRDVSMTIGEFVAQDCKLFAYTTLDAVEDTVVPQLHGWLNALIAAEGERHMPDVRPSPAAAKNKGLPPTSTSLRPAVGPPASKLRATPTGRRSRSTSPAVPGKASS